MMFGFIIVLCKIFIFGFIVLIILMCIIFDFLDWIGWLYLKMFEINKKVDFKVCFC